MRYLLALAMLFGSASAYAAPVPKELRKETRSDEGLDGLVLNPLQIAHNRKYRPAPLPRQFMEPLPMPDEPVNGTTAPMK